MEVYGSLGNINTNYWKDHIYKVCKSVVHVYLKSPLFNVLELPWITNPQRDNHAVTSAVQNYLPIIY